MIGPGQLIEGKDITENVAIDADVVVVGSGGGGGPFAYKMAQAGKRVVVLEAGGYYTSRDFVEREEEMTRLLYVEGGAQGPADGSLTLYQGKCVGGSTVINAMICFRPPERVLDRWRDEFGVQGLGMKDLLPSVEEVEAIVSSHENEAHEINRGNRLLMEGASKLGWHAAPLRRNVKECVLSGFCLLGCAYDRKRSVLVTYIPMAVEYGATVIADAEVDQVLHSGGRATGVVGTIRDRATGAPRGRIEVRAKVVALAGGAVQTPCILQRSGLADLSGMVGRNFAVHPSASATGIFDEKIRGWRGALCGTYCGEFHEPSKGGFLIEGGMGGPIMTGLTYPDIGDLPRDLAEQYEHMANCVSIVHDPGVGRVNYDGKTGKAKIEYALDADTRRRTLLSVRTMAEIWFSAGARRVVTAFTRPLVLNSPDEVGKIEKMSAGPNDLALTSYHPQGTARMGADKKKTVVASNGESHTTRGLFVVDTSVFPTAVDVNPQITVMSVATHFARGILAEPGRYFG
ncbi:MAG: GMC family oxidoreductase [Myxococcales bacterium]|nr:GMC family oxidoreductase [Myxococcales bacterium]